MSDRARKILKGGWHPSGDVGIHRATWKEDLKGIATGKKKDPNEASRDHQSTPLSSLKDPDTFGPPPKQHSFSTPSASGSAVAAPPQGGLGSAVPAPSRTRQQGQQQEPEQPEAPPGPYRVDTSGLQTHHLPKPPVRRTNLSGTPPPSSPTRAATHGTTHAPAVPQRHTPVGTPPLPPRSAGVPPPMLPPRQNEYPDQHTPAPPPPYVEPIKPSMSAGLINQGAAARLSQAGVSVPGFDIGALPVQSNSSPRGPQLSELQKRFQRMEIGADTREALPPILSSAIATGKKPAPPPPPPKRNGLGSGSRPSTSDGQPPPLPLASKPRFE